MSQTHYKLPLDTEVDEDIMNWIGKYHRTKKGEMVRHAIRYYMAVQGAGDADIQFPNAPSTPVRKQAIVETPVTTQADKNKKERKKPQLNSNALK